MDSQHPPARVCALGFFDGLHRGHMALMETAARRAKEKHALFSVVTFKDHPQSVISGAAVPLLSSNECRADMLRRLGGAGEVIFLPFDGAMMRLCWRTFLSDILIGRYRALSVVAGENFRFGFGGRGDARRMAEFCRARHVGCDIVASVSDGGEPVSATRIRSLVAEGRMEEAAALLGHPHEICGVVERGRGIGSKMGLPTLNIPFPAGLVIPPLGVYAGRAHVAGASYNAVLNIGRRPTFSDAGGGVVLESHLMGFDGDAYGASARFELFAFLRPERAFPSAEALRGAILEDRRRAAEHMKSHA